MGTDTKFILQCRGSSPHARHDRWQSYPKRFDDIYSAIKEHEALVQHCLTSAKGDVLDKLCSALEAAFEIKLETRVIKRTIEKTVESETKTMMIVTDEVVEGPSLIENPVTKPVKETP